MEAHGSGCGETTVEEMSGGVRATAYVSVKMAAKHVGLWYMSPGEHGGEDSNRVRDSLDQRPATNATGHVTHVVHELFPVR